MTPQEAIEKLKSKMDGHTDTSYEWAETVRMAIKVLEQQPCEDCISREQAVYVASGYCAPQNIADELRKLPSVTPQPKRGKWIATNDYVTTAYGSLDYYRCSYCGEDSLEEGNFCPNCGADMREGCEE